MSKKLEIKNTESNPEEVGNNEPNVETNETVSIKKPSGFSLDKFKVKRPPTIAGVDPLQQSLAVMKISDANDFVHSS